MPKLKITQIMKRKTTIKMPKLIKIIENILKRNTEKKAKVQNNQLKNNSNNLKKGHM